MALKRDWGLIFLWVAAIWGAGKALEVLARFATVSDYAILSAHGLGWLFFVVAGINLMLWVTFTYYLTRPAPVVVTVGFAALAYNALYNGAMTFVLMQDLPAARTAYAVSREARGMPVREETLNAVFSVSGIWGSFLLSLLIMAIVAVMLWRKRRWFGADVAELDA